MTGSPARRCCHEEVSGQLPPLVAQEPVERRAPVDRHPARAGSTSACSRRRTASRWSRSRSPAPRPPWHGRRHLEGRARPPSRAAHRRRRHRLRLPFDATSGRRTDLTGACGIPHKKPREDRTPQKAFRTVGLAIARLQHRHQHHGLTDRHAHPPTATLRSRLRGARRLSAASEIVGVTGG